MLEVELKVRIDALERVQERLIARSARFCGKVHEHDVYYSAPHRDFAKTDEALRVRYTDYGGEVVVTYKGPKIKQLGLKAREELNTEVGSGEVFERMLQRLGFVRVAAVDKWRENYQLENAIISLDRVEQLGTFIEISDEGSKNDTIGRINQLAKELGVRGEPILASYLELLLSIR